MSFLCTFSIIIQFICRSKQNTLTSTSVKTKIFYTIIWSCHCNICPICPYNLIEMFQLKRSGQSDTIVVLKTILSLFFHLVYEENMKKQKNNRPSASWTRALRFLNPWQREQQFSHTLQIYCQFSCLIHDVLGDEKKGFFL